MTDGQVVDLGASIDADGNLHVPVAMDLGPALQQDLSSAGLAGRPSDLSGGPPDNLPPPEEASQAQLAETLLAAERTTPKQKKMEEAAPIQPDPDPFLVGHWRGITPIYGCPGCAIRGRKPEDIMWHLRSFPAHARRR